jgi:hypothetical protein
MIDIDTFMHRFCDTGAAAMTRYAEISREAPDQLPEYFISSYILDHVGGGVGGTLETSFSKLTALNNELRESRHLPPRKDADELLVLAEAIGTPRVDLALVESVEPSQRNFIALAEFKKGEFNCDREKLLRILKHIDRCPYGVVCGSIGNKAGLEWWTTEIKRTNDRWYVHPVSPRHFFCARLLQNTVSE